MGSHLQVGKVRRMRCVRSTSNQRKLLWFDIACCNALELDGIFHTIFFLSTLEKNVGKRVCMDSLSVTISLLYTTFILPSHFIHRRKRRRRFERAHETILMEFPFETPWNKPEFLIKNNLIYTRRFRMELMTALLMPSSLRAVFPPSANGAAPKLQTKQTQTLSYFSLQTLIFSVSFLMYSFAVHQNQIIKTATMNRCNSRRSTSTDSIWIHCGRFGMVFWPHIYKDT